jgi:hypothetical protein
VADQTSSRVRVITMVKNEQFMLGKWLDYYGGQFGRDRLLVIDDSTDDGSTDNLDVPVLRIDSRRAKSDDFDFNRTQLVNHLAQGLLLYDDYVIYTDADEFLVADPDRYESLPAFLADNPGLDVVSGVGLNVLHNVREEPEFDPSRPILQQRHYAKFARRYCKPLIKRVPNKWGKGFHSIGHKYDVNTSLYLLHLKWYDLGTSLQRQGLRHSKMLQTGAGRNMSWRLKPEDMESRYYAWCDPERHGHNPPEFSPTPDLIGDVVESSGQGMWRSGNPQTPSAMKGPLFRIPSRLSNVF